MAPTTTVKPLHFIEVGERVPKTPKVHPWSIALRDQARAEGKYMKADDKGTLSLTNAKKRWVDHPDVVYAPGCRLAGTRQQIRDVLVSHHVTTTVIDDYLGGAWSKDNCNDNVALFEQDCQNDRSRAAAAKANTKATSELSAKIDSIFEEIRSNKGIKTEDMATTKSKKAALKLAADRAAAEEISRRRNAILKKIKDLDDAHVLDCSSMSDGQKMAPLHVKAISSCPHLIRFDGIASDNVPRFEALVQFLGGDYVKLIPKFKAEYKARSATNHSSEEEVHHEQVHVAPPSTPVRSVSAVPLKQAIASSSVRPVVTSAPRQGSPRSVATKRT